MPSGSHSLPLLQELNSVVSFLSYIFNFCLSLLLSFCFIYVQITQFFKKQNIKTHLYLTLLPSSGFNLLPLCNQTSYFHCLTSHPVFFNLQSSFCSIMPPDWFLTKVPNGISMSLNPNGIFH